jgi:hypothetical protein
MLAGLSSYMIASFFGIPYTSQASTTGSTGVPIDWWVCLVTCTGAIGCGLAMLLKPKWWIAKYFAGMTDEGNQVAFERMLRIECALHWNRSLLFDAVWCASLDFPENARLLASSVSFQVPRGNYIQ